MNAPMTGTRPTSPTDRVIALDSLRGFALWGVFVVNTLIIAHPPQGDISEYVIQSPGDEVTAWFVRALVSGKFYTLFAFLFGVSFSLMLARLNQQASAGTALLRRRLLILLGIGIAHSVLIWNGDILKFYAVGGFVLLAMRRLSPTRHLRLALFLLAVFYIAYAAIAVVIAVTQDPGATSEAVTRSDAVENVFTTGTFAAATLERFRILISPQQLANLVGAAFYILPLFLLGFWFGARGLFLPLGNHCRIMSRLFFWSASAGLLSCAGFLYFGAVLGGAYGTAAGAAKVISEQLSNLALGFLVVSLFVIGAYRNPESRTFVALAPMGRMALTNYLAHSLIVTWVMYGYGGGLAGRFGVTILLLVATGLFLTQLGLSHLWLRRYRFGPMEWLWRSLTYRALQPMHRMSP